jgi:hypothetical protein
MYNEAKKESPRPILSAFVDVFITYAKLASFIILFDAFDECEYQGIMISQLIRRMYNSGIKVFITHRPHVLQNPKNDFEELNILEIQAHDEDIECYTIQRLIMEEKAKRLDDTFKSRIIKEIRDRAKGMYDFSFRAILIIGSSLQISNWNTSYERLDNPKWKRH